jgi:predicted tellurium resistance membrane protein TerC
MALIAMFFIILSILSLLTIALSLGSKPDAFPQVANLILGFIGVTLLYHELSSSPLLRDLLYLIPAFGTAIIILFLASIRKVKHKRFSKYH